MTQRDESERFDQQRKRAARRSREDAAVHHDPTQARLLEMCADDLSRDLTDAERKIFRKVGLDV